MPGEYYRWLARNEKPRERKELTKEEKWTNWWDYNRTAVIIGAIVLALVVWFAIEVAITPKRSPDYRIAYIGAHSLPKDTVSALESKLAEWGIDLTGDGKVKVQVLQYIVAQDADYYTEVSLMTDFTAGTSPFFLCEDPQAVQKIYEAFSYIDGTYPPPGAAPTEKLWYSWDECVGLSNLELGEYKNDPDFFSDGLTVETGSNQELLSKLYLARRGPWEGLEEERAQAFTQMYRLFLFGVEQSHICSVRSLQG